MNIVLTIDFGSTFTKISAVDIENAKIIATAKSFTTIETDVRHGLENALAIMERENGKIEFSKKIASSSAAGASSSRAFIDRLTLFFSKSMSVIFT